MVETTCAVPDSKIIGRTGNAFYVNNCRICARYDKKPVKVHGKGNFKHEYYYCAYFAPREHNDYRCYNAGMFNRHNDSDNENFMEEE